MIGLEVGLGALQKSRGGGTSPINLRLIEPTKQHFTK